MPLPPGDKPVAQWDEDDFRALEPLDALDLDGDTAIAVAERASEGGFWEHIDRRYERYLRTLAEAAEARRQAVAEAAKALAEAEAQAAEAEAQAAATSARVDVAFARSVYIGEDDQGIAYAFTSSNSRSSNNVRSWPVPVMRLAPWDLDFNTIPADARAMVVAADDQDTIGPINPNWCDGALMSAFTFNMMPQCAKVLRRHFNDGRVLFLPGTCTMFNTRPDGAWIHLTGAGTTSRSKTFAVHDHKRIWGMPLPEGIDDLLRSWNVYRNRDVGDVLAQVYGHMIALGLKYAALSTTRLTWFFRRNEDDASDPRLEVTKAYVGTDVDGDSARMAYLVFLFTAFSATMEGEVTLWPAEGTALFQHAYNAWIGVPTGEGRERAAQEATNWYTLLRSAGAGTTRSGARYPGTRRCRDNASTVANAAEGGAAMVDNHDAARNLRGAPAAPLGPTLHGHAQQ